MTYVVDNCCFCCQLKTGCYVIGSVMLALTLITIGLLGFAAGSLESACYSNDCSGGAIIATRIITWIMLLVMVVYAILCILLVHGIRVDRPKYMAPWMIWTIVNCVLSIVRSIMLFFSNITEAVSGLIYVCLMIYFVIVIRSYYLQLRGQAPVSAKV